MMIYVGDLLSGANAILAAIIVYQAYRGWKHDRYKPWGWLKLSQVIIAALWVPLNLYLLITSEDIAQAQVGRFLARPMITATLSVIAAGAIIGAKRNDNR